MAIWAVASCIATRSACTRVQACEQLSPKCGNITFHANKRLLLTGAKLQVAHAALQVLVLGVIKVAIDNLETQGTLGLAAKPLPILP